MKQELPVVGKFDGIGKEKDAYIVIYKEREHRVPLFEFQKDRKLPSTIMCVVGDKQAIRQDMQVLFDEFYTVGQPYLLKVKRKWPLYYELEDERASGEDITLTLPCSPGVQLEIGQLIQCQVVSFDGRRPLLVLKDANPSTISFLTKHDIFSYQPGDTFGHWLEDMLSTPRLSEASAAYRGGEGRWICLLSQQMDYMVNSLLLSPLDDKDALLSTLCGGWIGTVEHSSFMGKLTRKEVDEYSAWLTQSIEICEDYLDAMAITDRAYAADKIVASLDPDFYQYRIEKRFRLLAYLYATTPSLIGQSAEALLQQLARIGEDSCSGSDVYSSVTTILRLMASSAANKWANCMSIPGEAKADIGRAILALCYLVKLMGRHGESDINLCVSSLYTLLFAYMSYDNERRRSLDNAYHSLFNPQSLLTHSWERLTSIVRSSLYYLCVDSIEGSDSKPFRYDNGSAYCEFGPHHIKLAPHYYTGDMAKLNVSDTLTLQVCYDKSLSKLDHEENFINVRNAWRSAHTTLFTPIKASTKKRAQLFDGDEADIYVTQLLPGKHAARCRAVGYDEEGTIQLGDLLFYDKPNVALQHFLGTNGSPLLFKAVCNVKGGAITFNAGKYKESFAKLVMHEQEEINCFVISRAKDGSYLCITDMGVFAFVKSDIQLKPQKTFVRAEVTSMLPNGNARATLIDVADEELFDAQNIYPDYLVWFNQFIYEKDDEAQWTLSDRQEHDAAKQYQLSKQSRYTMVQAPFVAAVADILCKMAEMERNPRRRYGYLATCKMMATMASLHELGQLCDMRMKYAEIMYGFALNKRIGQAEVGEFNSIANHLPNSPEVSQRRSIVYVLSKFTGGNVYQGLDRELVSNLETSASPMEKELTRLVLSNNILANFINSVLRDKVLEEMGRILNTDIFRPRNINMGQESQTLEFKTSLVFPPDNHGHDDIAQQSDNILRVVLSMMNTRGGTLYIGVNDDGNVVGLYNDLAYFSEANTYNEAKARDNFKNYFSCFLTEKLGAEVASKLEYDFEAKGDYLIFRIEIPVIRLADNDLFRVGNTTQRDRQL